MSDSTFLPATTGDDGALEAALRLVEDAVSSPSTRRDYRRALIDSVVWYRESAPRGPLSKALVQRYAAELREGRLSPASINNA